MNHRRMKAKLFLLFALLASGYKFSFACGGPNVNAYYGEITYKVDSASPLTVTVIVSLNFDIPDSLPNDSIWVNWGDASESAVFANYIGLDSVANNHVGYNRYYTHVYSGTHTYSALPDSGYYVIGVLNQYRENNISNINFGSGVSVPFYIETQVVLDTAPGFTNQAPVLIPSTIGFTQTNTQFILPGLDYNPGMDSIVFELIVPELAHANPVYQYQYPDKICNSIGESDSVSINAATGEIYWQQPCMQGGYTITTIARKYRQGRYLGSIMRDQTVYVGVNDSGTNIPDMANNSIQLYPNPATSVIQLQTEQPVTICIINMLGETIRKQNIQPASAVDISDLSNGVYFMVNEKNSFVAKFVKQ